MSPHPSPSAARTGPVASRRAVLRGAAVLGVGALGLLTACGSAGPAASGGAAPAGGADTVPRRVPHRFGTTEVSGSPQRVLTTGLTDQDFLIALGVVPVAVRDWFGDQRGALWPWARAAAPDAAPEVLPVTDLNYEQIAAIGPDLIVGGSAGLTQEQYDRLSGIAPTVAQPAEFPEYGAPWQVIARHLGLAVGREAAAEEQIAALEQRFARTRAENPQFAGRTGLLATQLEDGTYYIYAEGPAPGFLAELGLALPAAADAEFTTPERSPVALSPERLAVLEADVLVLGLYGPDTANRVAGDPVFNQLIVARQGRVIALPELSTANGALSFGSTLSLPTALDELVPRIIAALDGDPTTAVAPAV